MMLVKDNKSRNLFNPWFGFPQLFDEDFMTDFTSASTGLNIWEDEKANKIVVEAPFPGINSKDIDVQLKNGVLTMRADREESDTNKDGRKVHSWSMKSSYYYSTILPTTASNDVDATLKDGILRLEIKKTEESRPKKIEIKG